jgi:adenylate kinase family enzyme
MRRVSVVGTSCSGKSHLSARLAEAAALPHTQLDAEYWLPDWQERPADEFRARVESIAAGDRWIIDGNYSKAQDLVLARATHVVWLNYSFPLVFRRALSRTLRRVTSREELYAGNRESFRRSFLSHDSILLWIIATHGHNRRKYGGLRGSPEWQKLQFVELKRSREADELISAVQKVRARPERPAEEESGSDHQG